MKTNGMLRSIFIYILFIFVFCQSQLVCAGDFQKTGKKTGMSDYNGPQDMPKEWTKYSYNKMIKPYIEEAKKTYPKAKSRYLSGLPTGYTFFVTVNLHERNAQENAFMAVRKISDGKITAVLATKLIKLTSYKFGEELVFPESEVIDWTITSPDGKEEGNFLGKFLDKYYRTHQ